MSDQIRGSKKKSGYIRCSTPSRRNTRLAMSLLDLQFNNFKKALLKNNRIHSVSISRISRCVQPKKAYSLISFDKFREFSRSRNYRRELNIQIIKELVLNSKNICKSLHRTKNHSNKNIDVPKDESAIFTQISHKNRNRISTSKNSPIKRNRGKVLNATEEHYDAVFFDNVCVTGKKLTLWKKIKRGLKTSVQRNYTSTETTCSTGQKSSKHIHLKTTKCCSYFCYPLHYRPSGHKWCIKKVHHRGSKSLANMDELEKKCYGHKYPNNKPGFGENAIDRIMKNLKNKEIKCKSVNNIFFHNDKCFKSAVHVTKETDVKKHLEMSHEKCSRIVPEKTPSVICDIYYPNYCRLIKSELDSLMYGVNPKSFKHSSFQSNLVELDSHNKSSANNYNQRKENSKTHCPNRNSDTSNKAYFNINDCFVKIPNVDKNRNSGDFLDTERIPKPNNNQQNLGKEIKTSHRRWKDCSDAHSNTIKFMANVDNDTLECMCKKEASKKACYDVDKCEKSLLSKKDYTRHDEILYEDMPHNGTLEQTVESTNNCDNPAEKPNTDNVYERIWNSLVNLFNWYKYSNCKLQSKCRVEESKQNKICHKRSIRTQVTVKCDKKCFCGLPTTAPCSDDTGRVYQRKHIKSTHCHTKSSKHISWKPYLLEGNQLRTVKSSQEILEKPSCKKLRKNLNKRRLKCTRIHHSKCTVSDQNLNTFKNTACSADPISGGRCRKNLDMCSSYCGDGLCYKYLPKSGCSCKEKNITNVDNHPTNLKSEEACYKLRHRNTCKAIKPYSHRCSRSDGSLINYKRISHPTCSQTRNRKCKYTACNMSVVNPTYKRKIFRNINGFSVIFKRSHVTCKPKPSPCKPKKSRQYYYKRVICPKCRRCRRVRYERVYGCDELYMNSLRRRPYTHIYDACPWFYPHCLSFLVVLKHAVHVFLFSLAMCVWCPCLFAMEFCRFLCCCLFCAN